METTAIVQVRRLSKSFGDRQVLQPLDLEVYAGEIFGILGANGAGKTTLLKLVAGLLEPTEGGVQVLGASSWQQRDRVLRQLGSLIETPVFYEQLSGAENLSIHLAYMGAAANIATTLERVGLGDVGDKPVRKYSLGMRQRLAIARCLCHRPQVLLLDEPINGLDPIAIQEIRQLLCTLRDEGVTILLSSHILSEVALTVDRIGVLVEGRLVHVSPMAELQAAHPDNLEDYIINLIRGGNAHV